MGAGFAGADGSLKDWLLGSLTTLTPFLQLILEALPQEFRWPQQATSLKGVDAAGVDKGPRASVTFQSSSPTLISTRGQMIHSASLHSWLKYQSIFQVPFGWGVRTM